MQYNRLGMAGMKISAISLGAWLTYGSDNVKEANAIKCIHTAIENGINFIDVANVYAKGEAEKTVGKAIKDFDRSKLVISTKAFGTMSDDVNDRGLSRKHISESVNASLQRLGLDYIDIFFCHRYDTDSPTEETIMAISDLIHQGKILYWGTSMWQPHQIQEALAITDRRNAYRPVVEQPRYNMLDRQYVEGDLEAVLGKNGIGLTVYSPLAQGLLTGKYNDGIPKDSRFGKSDSDEPSNNIAEHRIETVRELTALAKEMGVEMSALALAWALHHPNVDSVITGATKPEHILSNIKALDIDLSHDVQARIEAILGNRPFNSQREVTHPDEVPAL